MQVSSQALTGPAGNVTGVSFYLCPHLMTKATGAVCASWFPKLAMVGVLVNPNYPASDAPVAKSCRTPQRATWANRSVPVTAGKRTRHRRGLREP